MCFCHPPPLSRVQRASPVFIQEYSVGDLDAPFLRQTITLPHTQALVDQQGVTGTRLCTSANRNDNAIESHLTLSVDGKMVTYGCFASPAGATNYSSADKVIAVLRREWLRFALH